MGTQKQPSRFWKKTPPKIQQRSLSIVSKLLCTIIRNHSWSTTFFAQLAITKHAWNNYLFFLPAGMQKQHSCFANVRSPKIWQVGHTTKLATSQMFQSDKAWNQLLVFFFPRGCKNNIPVLLTLDHPKSDSSATQPSLLPLKCFKAIKLGTNYLFFSSRGAKTTFLFC